jgi:peroxiredoxin Q/BCP
MQIENFLCQTIQQQTDIKSLFGGNQYLVLYFYPKDMTSGCTLESIDFSENYKRFMAKSVQVVGVSKDSVKSHLEFQQKCSLPFELIADEDLRLCEAFGVMQEKSMYGKKYMGIVRSTFLLNPELKVLHEWRDVSVNGHVRDVLAVIEGLV